MSEEKSIHDIRKSIEHLVGWDINSYHHEQWMTTNEGIDICNIMTDLANYIEKLEDKIDKLENPNREY